VLQLLAEQLELGLGAVFETFGHVEGDRHVGRNGRQFRLQEICYNSTNASLAVGANELSYHFVHRWALSSLTNRIKNHPQKGCGYDHVTYLKF